MMKRAILIVATMALFCGVNHARADYSAVGDFSDSSNPNSPWSYLYVPVNTSTTTLLSTPVTIVTNLSGWTTGYGIPDDVVIAKNYSGSTLTDSTRIVPTDLLLIDPERNIAMVRWTAPSAGTYLISGLFQGIDDGQHSHSVEVVENSSVQLLGPTTLSSYGQQVSFSDTVTLAAGGTIDFSVACVGGDFYNLSTGLSATISPAAIATPEPSGIALLGLGVVCLAIGYVVRMRIPVMSAA